MNVTVCREGAWTELTIRVTPVIAVQSETHGFKYKIHQTPETYYVLRCLLQFPEFIFTKFLFFLYNEVFPCPPFPFVL
ncbi:hypothetical protein LXJ15735_41430 [Lacrimispora xylanolytica]